MPNDSSFSRGASRIVAVSKSHHDSLANANQSTNKQITVALNNSSLLNDVNHYLQQFPMTSEDNEILQAKIQKTPSSLNGSPRSPLRFRRCPLIYPSSIDWFYCTLLRSGNPLAKVSDVKVRVPERRFRYQDYPNASLPIDKTAICDNLHHLIESNDQPLGLICWTTVSIYPDNKIVFINGPPAIGKSVRVSFSRWDLIMTNDRFVSRRSVNTFMMITSKNDGHWEFFTVVRIVSTLMLYRRFSHRFIRQSIVSPWIRCRRCRTSSSLKTNHCRSIDAESNASITITTHEFLLHTLISGDFLFKASVTHLIVDNVHKRSHTLDMLLAYLKDAQQKFRHLKIILLQTTMQYDTLVKYFGNVATYTSKDGLIDLSDDCLFLC